MSFLLHFPSAHAAWPLASTLPCAARTFLPPCGERSRFQLQNPQFNPVLGKTVANCGKEGWTGFLAFQNQLASHRQIWSAVSSSLVCNSWRLLLRRLLLLVLLLLSPALLAAVETAPRISDREIIEGLADIKGDIKRLDAEIKAIRVELRTEIRGALRVLH